MKGRTIGIIGGGQLGRMLTLAAKPLGFDVIVVNPAPNSPAAQVGAEEIVADLYDQKALNELAERADFITIEIEHMDAGALEIIAAMGTPVNPAPTTIAIIQDKLWQKQLLRKAGVAVVDFVEIKNADDAHQTLKLFGGRMLLKTRTGAYDGRGNRVIKKESEIKNAMKDFGDTPLYAEKFVPFTKELAVLVARDMKGRIVVYPPVETIHKNNICHEVLSPAPIRRKYLKSALQLAYKTAQLLQGAGVFAVEMFLTKDGKVLVNEIAPRVHNSGHHTIEANYTSQFEQHIRAITGLPLGDPRMQVPAAVMINILGERNGDVKIKGDDKVLAKSHVHLHLYGKGPTKQERKMGHITATGKTLAEARKKARIARKRVSI